MEFLDPKKQREHLIRLFIGYALIATALILTTIILLYQANGFGIKNGEVIQSGLVFMSSSPNPADIYVNGQKRPEQTNSRLLMPAGQYVFELQRTGYESWKRAVSVEGGTVIRFDYPMLIPSKLQTTIEHKYDIPPSVVTESPDRHWLLLQANPSYNVFDIADISKPFKTPVIQTINLPNDISTLAGMQTWKTIEWSNDNQHVLMQHIVTDASGKVSSEYILIDRQNPDKSVNLTNTLGVNPTQIEMQDKKYDKYFLYTQDDRKLWTATLDQPKPVQLLDHILAYKTYGMDMVLYVTDKDAPMGKTSIRLLDGTKTYTIRQTTPSPTYMLELTKYQNDWYLVAGASIENRTYVYKNPMDALDNNPSLPLVPVQVVKVANPNYVAFSDDARLIMIENGQQFGMYDAQNKKGYAYSTGKPIDAPQAHAEWMDGAHVAFISSGKTYMFDFDNTNQHVLTNTDSAYGSFFDKNYQMLYGFTTQAIKTTDGKDAVQIVLNGTALVTPADQ